MVASQATKKKDVAMHSSADGRPVDSGHHKAQGACLSHTELGKYDPNRRTNAVITTRTVC